MIPDLSPGKGKGNETSAAPSPWVVRFAGLIEPGGRVLDLACGSGRHACWLADLGHVVEAVDRDAVALAELSRARPQVRTRVADLEGGPWPYHGCAFDAIVVTNYLYRPLLPLILSALDSNGVLIYETFMVGNERFGKPSNPAFLLHSGELLEVVRQHLNIVAFEQGEVATPRPLVVQRLCATRRIAWRLPETGG
ncbi:MAG: SAM-dependent methyltransferase [Betaproteobacteria bacterium HGW-Betaproteobacteria-11]|nr:MAG: SAM-dependent methyltransferase [Betaproteobacteria bacterium HGW-Betaproteobacteria-11]